MGGKSKNIIRCGDINQAITTTFSNADVEGFREFIQNAQTKVSMNHSQRCAQGVMDCANNLVEYGKIALPSAFFDIKMEGVEGKNPISQTPIVKKIFDMALDGLSYYKIADILTSEGIKTPASYYILNGVAIIILCLTNGMRKLFMIF